MPSFLNGTLGSVLYNNILSDAEYVVSDFTEEVGFEVNNISDYRDFSLCRIVATGTNPSVTWSFPSRPQAIVDSVGIYVRSLSVPAVFTIEVSPAPSAPYQTLASFILGVGDTVKLCALKSIAPPISLSDGCSVKLSVGISIGESIDIRELFVGNRLLFPSGQHVGMAPTGLKFGQTMSNNVSINGSILGRDVRRVMKSGTIELVYMDESWVRVYWEQFIASAERRPFFYSWDLIGHPDDTLFCSATDIVPPENIMPTPTMRLKMPWVGIGG